MSGKCAICGRKHTEDFPEDFPEEWQMCCFCVSHAEGIIEFGLDFVIDMVKESYEYFINPRRIIRKYIRINKLVTLMG